MTEKLSDCCKVEITSRTELAGVTYYCTACNRPCNESKSSNSLCLKCSGTGLYLDPNGRTAGDCPVCRPDTVDGDLREKIAKFLFEDSSIYDAKWRECLNPSYWEKKANSILNLIQPLIEQVRKEEREKVIQYVDNYIQGTKMPYGWIVFKRLVINGTWKLEGK